MVLLIDPADSRNGRAYRDAVHDLGFRVVSLSTGPPSTAAPLPVDSDGELSLHADDVDDAVRQVRAAGLDLRSSSPPVIVKQTMGSGSYGVLVIGEAAELNEATKELVVDWLDQPVTEWLVEQYVRGREYAVNSAAPTANAG
ncbi:ATP-grasp domain-containing protein [Streptomyces sp. NPDC058371]|uniref:ATP-grasp domain-containing protein n=1 Tax=Streptomyces sp. NPDC058371 TaxID=3346463 RepID=UPI00364A9727